MSNRISKAKLEEDNELLYQDNKKLIADNMRLANKANKLDSELMMARSRIGLLESRLGISGDSCGKDKVDLCDDLAKENTILKQEIKKLESKCEKQASERSKLLVRVHELEMQLNMHGISVDEYTPNNEGTQVVINKEKDNKLDNSDKSYTNVKENLKGPNKIRKRPSK